jgi:hypothetical protein
MEDDAQMHILFLENQIRYHENQISWSADKPVKQKQHFALMSGLRGAAEYIRNHSNPAIPPSKNDIRDENKQAQQHANKDVLTVTKKSRLSRGEPEFEILRSKLLTHYPKNERSGPDPIIVSESDFKLIVEAFAKETDSSGRIRWGNEALKDLKEIRSGIHESKVQRVRKFLIKMGVLEAETQTSIYIVNTKIPLLQQATAAWQKLQQMKMLKD